MNQPHSSSAITWRKSSYSNTDGGSCVEVADGFPGALPVRDSKTPHAPAVIFDAAAWSCFVTAIKSGRIPRT